MDNNYDTEEYLENTINKINNSYIDKVLEGKEVKVSLFRYRLCDVIDYLESLDYITINDGTTNGWECDFNVKFVKKLKSKELHILLQPYNLNISPNIDLDNFIEYVNPSYCQKHNIEYDTAFLISDAINNILKNSSIYYQAYGSYYYGCSVFEKGK